MTKLISGLVTIGWLIEGLSKLTGFNPGMAIFGNVQNLEPEEFYLIHQIFPPFTVSDLRNGHSQGINVLFMDNFQPLWSMEEEFFETSSMYIFVTAANVTEVDAGFKELWRAFNAPWLFAVNVENDEAFFFDVVTSSTVAQALESLSVPTRLLTGRPDFNGRPFGIVYFRREESFVVDEEMNIIGGQDALAMKTIAETFNATVMLVETADGKRYGRMGHNGTAVGAFMNLLDGSAIITGNTHFLKYYGTEGLQFTHYLSSDRLCLLVPKPKKIPNYVALYRNVQYRWFYMYMAACFFGLVTIRRIDSLLGFGGSRMTTNLMISVVFRIFFGVPVVFRFNRLHERIAISSFLMATMVISNCFQSLMTTIASSPSYEKTMNTLADVRERGVKIYYSNDDVKSYLSNEDLIGLNFVKVSVQESVAAAKRTDIGRTHRTYSVFTKKNMYYKGVKTSKSMLIVPECLVDYPLAFAVPKGLGLLEAINWILAQFVESGLYLKWTYDSVPVATYVQRNAKESAPTEPVRNVEIHYAYALLGLGLAISTVVFAVEKIAYRRKRKTRTKQDKKNSKKHFKFKYLD